MPIAKGVSRILTEGLVAPNDLAVTLQALTEAPAQH